MTSQDFARYLRGFGRKLSDVAILTAMLLAALAVPLHANTLTAGQTVAPDVFPLPASFTTLANFSGTYSFGSGQALISGAYSESVVNDVSGLGCDTCLVFVLQVTLDPGLSSGLNDLSLARFFDYSTDAGYIPATGADPFTGGDGAPNAVTRSLNGNRVGFFFHTLNTVLAPGSTSADLIVVTNANEYDSNGALFIAGGRGTDSATYRIDGALEPIPTPEPAGFTLLAAGITSALMMRRRRTR